MIAQLTGRVVSRGLDSIVLSVHGLGFAVRVTPVFAQSIDVSDDVTVHTSLIVREDSLTLMGFAHPDERDTFETLQTMWESGRGSPSR